MAKRFTATEKWDDVWFFELSTEAKMFWLYLLDKCDHAGIWQVNMVIAKAYLGFTPTLEMVKDKINVLNQQKWFIPKFICFQYGELNPANRTHASVISILKKEGAYKPLTRGIQGAMDKDKDKDKEGGVGETIPKFSFETVWSKYPNKDGKKIAERSFHSSVKTEQDFKDIVQALENYLKSEKVQKGFIKNGSTWFNNWRDWVNPSQAMNGVTPEKQAGEDKKKFAQFLNDIEGRYRRSEINIEQKNKLIKEWTN
jgi:hypothetical protein